MKPEFRSTNNAFTTELRTSIILNAINPDTWNFICNQLYLDDMAQYLIGFSNSPVILGTGNYLPKVMIVTTNPSDVALIKNTLRSLGKPPEQYWITPFYKSLDLTTEMLYKAVSTEILKLLPEKIVFANCVEEDLGIIINKVQKTGKYEVILPVVSDPVEAIKRLQNVL